MSYSLGNLNGLSIAEFLARYDIATDIWYYPDPTLVWNIINGETVIIADKVYLIKTLSDGKWWYINAPELLYGLSGVPEIEEITDAAFIAQQEQGWAEQEIYMDQTGATYEQMKNVATRFPKHYPGLPEWVPSLPGQPDEPEQPDEPDTPGTDDGCDCDCEKIIETQRWVLTPFCKGPNCYPVKIKVRRTICEGDYQGGMDFDCNDIEFIKKQMNQGV